MVGIFIAAALLCFLIGFKYSNFAVSRQTETFYHSCVARLVLPKLYILFLVISCLLKKILALSTKKRNTKLSIASLRGIECYKIYT